MVKMKGMPDLPVLDETLCTGCGDCVAVCPTACLELVDALPWLPRPRDCVACALCATVCPAKAISIAGLAVALGATGERRPEGDR